MEWGRVRTLTWKSLLICPSGGSGLGNIDETPKKTVEAHLIPAITCRNLDMPPQALTEELSESFKLIHEEDMPFLIREHVRKYQWGCSHATVWKRL